MRVSISKDEVRVCTMLAQERWLEKFGSVDRPNYAEGKRKGIIEHDLLANIRANICEYAVSKTFNLIWNLPWYPNSLHPQRKSLPDVGENIEVRSIRTKDAIPFWKKDRGKWIVGAKVLDTEYYSEVEIYGRIKAEDYMNSEYWDESISGWRVPISEFNILESEGTQ